MGFWEVLDELVVNHRILIDRPEGSPHPRFPESIYPLDYGYLDGTRGGDGSGIDVWSGSNDQKKVVGVIITIDLLKSETEIKILIGCTDEEVETALSYLNTYTQSGILVKREG